MDELLKRMRVFVQDQDALCFIVQTKTRGGVAIWAADIRATANDTELRALVLAHIIS